MNILLINHYAGSPDMGMVFRSYYFANEWAKMGHDVTVVGASYAHLRWKQPVVQRNGQVDQYGERFRYLWLKTPSYGGTLARMINILVFVIRLWLKRRHIAKVYQPDIIVDSTTYLFDIYVARRIAKRANAKLVFEVRDMWPLTPILIGGYSPRHPFIVAMQMAEDYAYRNSDKVVSLLWNAEGYMREHGLAEGKFACVPNGYLPSEWQNLQPLPTEHAQIFEKLQQQKKTIIVFAGSHLRSAGVFTLFQALELLNDLDNLFFLFVGGGKDKQELQATAAERNYTNVAFLPSLPKSQLFRLLEQSHIGYVGGVGSKLYDYGGASNKRIDYMMAGLPIVASPDDPGGLLDVVGNGIRVPAEDPQAVADAIRQLASLPPDELRAMGQKGKEYAEANLSIPTLASRMLEAMVS